MAIRDRLPLHNTIAAFELARMERFRDAFTLGAHGRRFGAIYLLGYFVEMTLKSAFFTLLGFRTEEPITAKDLATAANLAEEDLRVDTQKEQYHSFVFWARAIVSLCDHFGDPIPSDTLQELGWRSQRMTSNWKVSMRYSQEIATEEEWTRFQDDANWLEGNYVDISERGRP